MAGKQVKSGLLLLCLFLLALALCACHSQSAAQVEETAPATEAQEEVLLQGMPQTGASMAAELQAEEPPKRVIDTDVFVRPDVLPHKLLSPVVGVRVAEEDLAATKHEWLAAVVPHHLLAGQYTAQVIAALAAQEPPLVIVLGPNHANGGAPIQTTAALWRTSVGDLAVDEAALEAVLATGLVVENDALFQEEHSIGTLMPFLAYYMPGVRVLPLAFHFDYSLEDGQAILEALAPFLAEGAVLLGSIDFSHGLQMAQAEEHDAQTEALLAAGDSQAIARLRSQNLDAPILLALLIEYAKDQGVEQPVILANTNSGRLMQDTQMDCTSYFSLLF